MSVNNLQSPNNFDLNFANFGKITYSDHPWGVSNGKSLDIINTADGAGLRYIRMIQENTSTRLAISSVNDANASVLLFVNSDSLNEFNNDDSSIGHVYNRAASFYQIYSQSTGGVVDIFRAIIDTVDPKITSINLGTVDTVVNLQAGAKLQMAGTAAGDILYNDGTGFVRLPAGSPGQTLTVSAGGLPEWS